MIVCISPTKNMKPKRLDVPMSLPMFCVEAESLLEILKSYNDEDIMNIMQVNAKLAVENQERFKKICFDTKGYHALSSYDGLAFKYMHLDTWKEKDLLYANQHLRILSGFYGVVKPFDSIYPYRLEMQAKGMSERIDNLYSFWNDMLLANMRADNTDGIYINLASKEYSQTIFPYIREDERVVSIHFQIQKNGVRKIQATTAKMARGEMVAWMMKHQIDDVESLKCFDVDGWIFQPEDSDDENFVYLKR